MANSNNNNTVSKNSKKRNRKKKVETPSDNPPSGVIEAGSDMEIDEEDAATTRDVSDKPEEKYAEEIKSYLRLTRRKDCEK